jgi:hypothetical protein
MFVYTPMATFCCHRRAGMAGMAGKMGMATKTRASVIARSGGKQFLRRFWPALPAERLIGAGRSLKLPNRE